MPPEEGGGQWHSVKKIRELNCHFLKIFTEEAVTHGFLAAITRAYTPIVF